jgi:hypothetical protein
MMPLPADDLEQAFRLYFTEMERSATAGHYFALLHVIVALPDLCAALENPDAPVAERYESWCGRYHRYELLSPAELYDLRCKLLHQGQAVGRGRGRYKTYSFPVHHGISVHRFVVEAEENISLDPRRMAAEMRQAVEAWFRDLRQPANIARLQAVRRRLPLLVREQPKVIPGFEGPSFTVMSST